MPLKSLLIKRRIIILLTFSILVFLGGYFYFQGTKQPPLEYALVEKQTIKQTISSSGVLTGKEAVNLRFKSAGKLANLNVKVGDQVTKGQSIALLDTQDLSIALQQAENTLRQKQAEVDQVLDDVKGHEKDEDFEQKVNRTAAEVARDNAYDNVKAAKRAFQDANIISPIAGIVTKADPIPGQVVAASDVIAQIVDDSEIYFDVEIDEGDIDQISVGQKVEVNLNSSPGKIFYGVVSQIKPITKITDSGATVVITRVLLNSPELSMVVNVNGQANIITNEKTNTLVIPSESLVDESSVYVEKDKDKYELVKIKTGISSDTHTEILEGLNEGQKVVKNPSVIKK